ncbi:hypothetical protein XA68_17933 [Ophiocordyceps unilateralis]|uniref:MACPF domain-containing protein n=1 Tax=Ophiocordyceps unilateralis TaxID=268505 RepID=A0A2A9PIA5_OPHUN|nr:hypothetical protein XA68_17933 [Ophiocordyceps unilateralis]
MRRMHWSLTTLLGPAFLTGLSLATKSRVPHTDFLTVGQGFNTFLGRGKTHNVVYVDASQKRDQLPAVDQDQDLHQLTFNFTPPSGDMSGVDVLSYFVPPDLESVHEAIERYKAELNNTNPRHAKRQYMSCPNNQNSGQMEMTSDIVTSYESYLKKLDISASAALAGYGQSASISGSYLDEAQFSSNSITALFIVKLSKQQDSRDSFSFNKEHYNKSTFRDTHGDRWIRGFVSGGKLLARVSIKLKSSSSRQDLEASAEAAVGYMGVSGSASTEVKNSMQTLQENADVKVNIFYQGDLARESLQNELQLDSAKSSVEATFENTKAYVTKFMETACEHDYKYEALLEEYANIPNFPRADGVEVWDYDDATAEAYGVLKELVKISEMSREFQQRPSINRKEKRAISRFERDMSEAAKKWVMDIAQNPTNVREKADELLERFKTDFHDKVKRTLEQDKDYRRQLCRKIAQRNRDMTEAVEGDRDMTEAVEGGRNMTEAVEKRLISRTLTRSGFMIIEPKLLAELTDTERDSLHLVPYMDGRWMLVSGLSYSDRANPWRRADPMGDCRISKVVMATNRMDIAEGQALVVVWSSPIGV